MSSSDSVRCSLPKKPLQTSGIPLPRLFQGVYSKRIQLRHTSAASSPVRSPLSGPAAQYRSYHPVRHVGTIPGDDGAVLDWGRRVQDVGLVTWYWYPWHLLAEMSQAEFRILSCLPDSSLLFHDSRYMGLAKDN